MKKTFLCLIIFLNLYNFSFAQGIECENLGAVSFESSTSNIYRNSNVPGIVNFNFSGGIAPYRIGIQLPDTLINVNNVSDSVYSYNVDPSVLTYLNDQYPDLEELQVVVTDSIGCTSTFSENLNVLKSSIIVTPSDCDINTGKIEITQHEQDGNGFYEDICDFELSPISDLIIDDSLVYCINDSSYNLGNVSVNKGTLSIKKDAIVHLSNLTIGESTIINYGTLVVNNTYNNNSDSRLINYGNITFKGDVNVAHNFENWGVINVVNTLNLTGSSIFKNDGTLSCNKLLVDGELILSNDDYVFNSILVNSSGEIQLHNSSINTQYLYNDGSITSFGDCAFINSNQIEGNSAVDSLLLCNASCSCSSEDSVEGYFLWEDGYIGNVRDSLASGQYVIEYIEEQTSVSEYVVNVPNKSECQDYLQSEADENFFNIYPNPQSRGDIQHFELGLSEESHVLVKIYNKMGNIVLTPYDGFYESGRYDFQWDGDETSENYAILICVITINGNTITKLFANNP